MDKEQIYLLKKMRKYFSKYENQFFRPKFNSIFYFATYSNFIGSYVIKKLAKIYDKNIFSNLNLIFKDFFFSLSYINNYLRFKSIPEKFNKLIITWAFYENFDKKGNLIDRYLNKNSKLEKNTLWFVIYMDRKIPKNIGKNVILFCKKEKKSFNVLLLFGFFIRNIKYLLKDLNYFLFSISNHNFLSGVILEKLKPFLNSKLKYVLIPYEGQPFQNNIIAYLKKKKYKIKTIGYIHSPPLAFPSNFIYKKNSSPDKIILNGKDQVYCFNKILGWKKSSIKLLPSFRFLQSSVKVKKIIYLPLQIRQRFIVLNSLKYLIENNLVNIINFKIRNHPGGLNSRQNLLLIRDIEKLKIKYKNYSFLKTKQDFLIFIGNSGGIIEALERGSKVIQIAEFPLFEIYSNRIWPSIIRKKINENIYIYSLKKKGNLIKLGNNKRGIFNFNNL
tara:strand:- start:120 stop:1451 length:1332 start_codon:yes stop_codon:yes gene_type:complete